MLGFEPDSVFADTAHDRLPSPSPLRIAVAGTGYVGLSIATLLAQHNHVTAVDILPEKDVYKRQKYTIELDVFEGALAPLVLAEVEFETEEEANTFVPPEWFGEDVTFSTKYHNSTLSQRTFSS